jgi:nitric oxide synthase oxygenase domain/subunit
MRRYVCKEIGLAVGYDTSNNATLWKDRVALEMNAAVLHSFKLANVTIVDQACMLRY